jgi:tetratricopeptide (TPR) repeat protein
MKRSLGTLILLLLTILTFAQDEMRVIDSLENVMAKQEGREKVLTMIELTWEFYDISYDDCLNWGEKAIKEAQKLGLTDLEADATFALAMQYGYHADLDLAQVYLKRSFDLHMSVGNHDRAFEDLWNQAYFEQIWGNMDSAISVYQEVLPFAEQRRDTLAMAQTCANMAIIQYQKHDFERSEANFKKSCAYYKSINTIVEEAKNNANLANLYMEWGRYAESRKLFQLAIPVLEQFDRFDYQLLTFKNYGLLFEKQFVNYDSASYYFDKAMTCIEQVEWPAENMVDVSNAKSDVLVEMGNVAVNRHDDLLAMNYFKEAFALAEKNKYHFGLMQAALSLGQLYAYQGEATLSLHYLDIYAEEAKKSGITMMESAAKKPLILDYARLGCFNEMAAELDALDEQKQTLQRENSDLYDQLSTIQDETQGLLQQNESQNNQIQILQTQRNHYRLAFFGLLAIVLFAVVLFVVYKIVRKKRAKV